MDNRNKKMKTIYLSGPLMFCTNSEKIEWRDKITKSLSSHFTILNPLRRNFRDDEFQSQNEIVQLDKKDIVDSDIVLANIWKPSIGTSMEIFFAWSLHKPVIIIHSKNYKDVSPWILYHSTRVCKSIEESIDYVTKHFI